MNRIPIGTSVATSIVVVEVLRWVLVLSPLDVDVGVAMCVEVELEADDRR